MEQKNLNEQPEKLNMIKLRLTEQGKEKMKEIKKDCQSTLFKYYGYGIGTTYLLFFLLPKKYINRKKISYQQISMIRNIAALSFMALVSYRSTWTVRNNMIYLQRQMLKDQKYFLDEIQLINTKQRRFVTKVYYIFEFIYRQVDIYYPTIYFKNNKQTQFKIFTYNMIRIEDFKNKRMLEYINEAMQDMSAFFQESNKEDEFIQEVFEKFQKLNDQYQEKLNEFLDYFFSDKKTLTKSFDDKSKENKRKVASIKKIILSVMKQQFVKYKQKFKKFYTLNLENVKTEMKNFNLTNTKNLQEKFQNFQQQFDEYLSGTKKYENQRKYYFDYISKQDSIELHKLKNYDQNMDKATQYINKKEWQIFKQTQIQTQQFRILQDDFYQLMIQYQTIYQDRFNLQTKLISWFDDNDKQKDYLKDQISKFQLSFKNFELNCYLNNLNKYNVTFCRISQVIKYKYSQSDPNIIKDIAKIRINELTEQMKDMVADIKFFTVILLYDFNIGKKTELESFVNCISNNLQYFDLLIINLNLIIKYEQKNLLLNTKSFNLLKHVCDGFAKTSQYSYDTNYNLCMIKNFFDFSSKTFNKDDNLLQQSLLSCMDFKIIQNNPIFWQAFYNYILQEKVSKEINYKQKQLDCIEQCIYYHCFFSRDIQYSKNYMLEVFIKFKLNQTYIDIDKLIYKTGFVNYQEKSKETHYKKNCDLERFLKLFIKKGYQFFDFDIYIKLISLKRNWYIKNRNLILQQKVLYQNLDDQTKMFLWLFLTKSENNNSKFRKLSQQSYRQIHMDVIRTRSLSQQQENTGKIQGLLQCFFENNEQKLDYYQGFNYIANFLYNIYQNHEDSLQIMRYVSKNMLDKFFTQDLALQIDELNFIAQQIIKKYFQQLYIHWQSQQIEINHLFQGYFVSLFTNLDKNYDNLIFDFWCFILFVIQKARLERIFFMFMLFYRQQFIKSIAFGSC